MLKETSEEIVRERSKFWKSYPVFQVACCGVSDTDGSNPLYWISFGVKRLSNNFPTKEEAWDDAEINTREYEEQKATAEEIVKGLTRELLEDAFIHAVDKIKGIGFTLDQKVRAVIKETYEFAEGKQDASRS